MAAAVVAAAAEAAKAAKAAETAGGNENLGTRGETKGDRHSGEIRVSKMEGNKSEEQGARNGAWILRFPASH